MLFAKYLYEDRLFSFPLSSTSVKGYITESVRKFIKYNFHMIHKHGVTPDNSLRANNPLKFNVRIDTDTLYHVYYNTIESRNKRYVSISLTKDICEMVVLFKYNYYRDILYTEYNFKLLVNNFSIDNVDYYFESYLYWLRPGVDKLDNLMKRKINEYRPLLNKHIKYIFNRLLYEI